MKISIDEDAQAMFAEMAAPYLGKEDCDPLAKAIANWLAKEFPQYEIRVAHVKHQPDLFVPQIRLLIEADGEMDNGLIFTRAPAAANDYVEVPFRAAA